MLTARLKREALEAVDFLLDYLFVPIRKDSWDEYLGLEVDMAELLLGGWNSQVKKGIAEIAAAVVELGKWGDGTVDSEDVKFLAEVLQDILGPELAKEVGDQAGDILKAAYVLGKEGLSPSDEYKAMLSLGLNLQDSAALDIMNKHTVYWIGNAYSEILSADIESIVATALKDGLGREEVARNLRDLLTFQVGERPDHYWRLLAGVVMNRSRNLGSVSGMVEAGVTVYEVFNPLDERTSDICRYMNGKTFHVSDLVKHRDAILSAKSPEEIKAIAPWHRVREKGGKYEINLGGSWKAMPGDSKSLGRLGLYLPPYHGNCRSSVIATEYDVGDPAEPVPVRFEEIPDPPPPPPTKPIPKQPAESKGPKIEPKEPVDEIPEEPDGWGKIPQAFGLMFHKNAAYLGGASKKFIFLDADGNQYLVKPGLTKAGTTAEAFRVYIQEATARLSYKLLGPKRTIEVVSRVLPDDKGNPILSSVQRLIGGVKGDLKQLGGLSGLNGNQLRAIFQEHTIDWLTGNFDAHAGQFIMLQDGKILGTDKENGFKFWKDPKSLRMSRTYAPNPEWPIYNDLFDGFAKGKIDLDLNDVLPAIQRVEAMSDQEFLDIFKKYRDALPISDADREKLAAHMLQRKHELREEYRRFFSELLEERTGKKGIQFQFADEIPKGKLAEQPLAAKAFSQEQLEGLQWKALFDMAKSQGLKYASDASKPELIAFLSNPSLKAEVEAGIKARKIQRTAAKKTAAQRTDRDEAIWDDLSLVDNNPRGEAFHRDSVAIEGQSVRVRRAVGDGFDGYVIEFKTAETEGERLFRELYERKDAKEGEWKWFMNASKRPNGFDISEINHELTSSGRLGQRNAWIIDRGDYTIEVWKNEYYFAMKGQVRIWVRGDGKQAAKRLKEALSDIKLDRAIAKPTPDDEYRLRLMRVLWQDNPEAERRLRYRWDSMSIEEIERAAGPQIVARAKRLVKKDLGGGAFTWVDPEFEKLYPDAVNVWAGLGTHATPTNAADVIESGLQGTVERWSNGIYRQGASSFDDMKSGGADSAFARLVTKGNEGSRYASHYKGDGPYNIVYSKRVLERTDWYGHHGDSYGEARPHSSIWRRRPSAQGFVTGQRDRYTYDNEIMFRRFIPTEYMERVDARSEAERQMLLDELRRRGITEVNGKPIEELVIVKEVTG